MNNLNQKSKNKNEIEKVLQKTQNKVHPMKSPPFPSSAALNCGPEVETKKRQD